MTYRQMLYYDLISICSETQKLNDLFRIRKISSKWKVWTQNKRYTLWTREKLRFYQLFPSNTVYKENRNTTMLLLCLSIEYLLVATRPSNDYYPMIKVNSKYNIQILCTFEHCKFSYTYVSRKARYKIYGMSNIHSKGYRNMIFPTRVLAAAKRKIYWICSHIWT